MNYIKLAIEAPGNRQELLIAELSEIGFDAFEQKDNRLFAYCREDAYPERRNRVERLLQKKFAGASISGEEVIEERNWNREWEQSIKPREIGSFLVRPTWEEGAPVEEKIELIIDPKMSFGTGYHETTQLMLEYLPELKIEGAAVLDVGTGTGILAIASAKLGAATVTAVDIDNHSVENAEENIRNNKVESVVSVKKGSVDAIPRDERFDLILANINRNTIHELSGDFRKRLSGSGNLLLSGLYESDKDDILDHGAFRNLKLVDEKRKEEWIALHLKKK